MAILPTKSARPGSRWNAFLAGCVLPLVAGCAGFNSVGTIDPPRREVPLAIRRFATTNATPTARPAESTLVAARKSQTPIRTDVLPVGFESPPVAVGDTVEPGTLPDADARPIATARPTAKRDESGSTDEVVAGSNHREKYVVARVEYVALTPPPAPSAETDQEAASDAVPGWSATVPEADDDFLDVHDLDLTTALQLVGGQNPRVAFANQRIAEASAQRDAAEALWLPSIRAGVSFHRHEGTLQASNGSIQDISRSSLQAGFGARAVGAGTTPVPGVAAEFHLSDAIFQPRVAERSLAASEFSSWVTYHDEMLRAAETYLELLRAHQERAIAEETLANADELVALTTEFSRTGQGAQADADRAATEKAIRHNDVARAREAVEVASARVSEALHLDAPLRVVPAEKRVSPIELVSLEPTVQQLVATGLSSRPEVGEQNELVDAACERLQREMYAPLLPSVLLGLSYGGFGGGLGNTVDDFNDRLNFDASAVWEIRNFGRGELAARNAAEARIEQVRFQQIQLMDRISREIVESRAQVRSRQRQIETARSAVTAAQQSYTRNRERINEGQGLPIEFLQALQALDQARREYLRSVTDYNVAQFRLHHALGWPVDAAEATLAARAQ